MKTFRGPTLAIAYADVPAYIKRRVAKGAAYLDADPLNPNWYNDIAISRLDMSLGKSCVLGQLDGDFFQAVEDRRLGQQVEWKAYSERSKVVRFGFTFDQYHGEGDYDQDWQHLQTAWLYEIDVRRKRDSS